MYRCPICFDCKLIYESPVSIVFDQNCIIHPLCRMKSISCIVCLILLWYNHISYYYYSCAWYTDFYVMAWVRTNYKTLSGLFEACSLTNICVTCPQWVAPIHIAATLFRWVTCWIYINYFWGHHNVCFFLWCNPYLPILFLAFLRSEIKNKLGLFVIFCGDSILFRQSFVGPQYIPFSGLPYQRRRGHIITKVPMKYPWNMVQINYVLKQTK